MSSPPPTPSEKVPKTDNEFRFDDTGYPCEWAELYRPGGYHPINLGDSFKNGQYRVIRKLGDASYSTVWLAKDNLNLRYVALKVMVAKSSATSATELAILKRIYQAAETDPMGKHVMLLLDTFEHSGPNGNHRCLVFEPMGSTVASMINKLPQNRIQLWGKRSPYPKTMAKTILKHTLMGLAFLHRNNIVHGDLQPGNLLFSIPDISSLSEEELQQDQSQQDQSTTPEPLIRLDRKDDKWAPRYLLLGQSLHKYVSDLPEMLIKISDFGSGKHSTPALPGSRVVDNPQAFWSEKPPKSTVTPVALRAPELIFGEEFDSSIDIWSFGCLIYEFLTDSALFCVTRAGNEDWEADDEHFLELNDVLEPLPDSWLKEKWPRADRYFGPNRERLHPFAEDEMDVEELEGFGEGVRREEGGEDEELDILGDVPFVNEALEKLFEKKKPDDIDDAEAKVVTTLIRQILRYEPSQRPTAEELLKHPWFQD